MIVPKVLSTLIKGILAEMNFVTHEELSAQQKILKRTELKLEAIEKKLIELEQSGQSS